MLNLIIFFSILSLTKAECTVNNINNGPLETVVQHRCDDFKLSLYFKKTRENKSELNQLHIYNNNVAKISFLTVETMSQWNIEPPEMVSDDLQIVIIGIKVQSNITLYQVLSYIGVEPDYVRKLLVYTCIDLNLFQISALNGVTELIIVSSDIDMTNMTLREVFPKLIKLQITTNRSRQPLSLAGLKYLEDLIMEECDFEEFPENYFLDNQALKSIHIRGDQMKKMPSFRGKKKLQTLNLDVTSAPFPDIKNCPELYDVNIHTSNELIELTEIFPEIPKLSSVFITRIGLQKVTQKTFDKNTQLIELSLYSNTIEDISNDSFVHLTKLKVLYIESNKLLKIFDTPLPINIEVVKFSGDQLEEFIVTKSLPRLKILELCESKISGELELGRYFDHYQALTFLNLQNNVLNSVVVSKLPARYIGIELGSNQIQTLTVLNVEGDRSESVKINLELIDNPLRCDCEMKSFIETLKQENPVIRIGYDAECESPKGETVKTVDLSNMGC